MAHAIFSACNAAWPRRPAIREPSNINIRSNMAEAAYLRPATNPTIQMPKKFSGIRWPDSHCRMLNSILLAIRFLILVLGDHKQVAMENTALRPQLAVFRREKKRPRVCDRDRLFWIALKELWKDWRPALVFVQPERVTGWQRKRFKRYWWRLSQSTGSGRPRVYLEIRKLVRTMAGANPIWGAPRIHGELLKLGFEISERTVSRLMPKDRKPIQTWM